MISYQFYCGDYLLQLSSRLGRRQELLLAPRPAPSQSSTPPRRCRRRQRARVHLNNGTCGRHPMLHSDRLPPSSGESVAHGAAEQIT